MLQVPPETHTGCDRLGAARARLRPRLRRPVMHRKHSARARAAHSGLRAEEKKEETEEKEKEEEEEEEEETTKKKRSL